MNQITLEIVHAGPGLARVETYVGGRRTGLSHTMPTPVARTYANKRSEHVTDHTVRPPDALVARDGNGNAKPLILR